LSIKSLQEHLGLASLECCSKEPHVRIDTNSEVPDSHKIIIRTSRAENDFNQRLRPITYKA